MSISNGESLVDVILLCDWILLVMLRYGEKSAYR